MLVDINFKQSLIDEYRKKIEEHCTPEKFEEIKNHIPKNLNDIFHRIDTGIYYTGLNFNHRIKLLSTNKIKDKFESFTFMKRVNGEVDWEYIRKCIKEGKEHKDNYGVCDNYQQVLDRYPELNDVNRKFVLSLCKISKKENSGWRWHKWGKYIGVQNSQCEYIDDESEIEEVYVYHIYEME